MPIEQVDDVEDPRLADYRDLRHGRPRGEGPVIVESMLGVEVLASSGLTIRSVLVTPAKLDRLPALGPEVPVLVADLDVQRATVGFDLHRGVVASAERPAPLAAETVLAGARRVVVTERLNDLENLGSLFRNARAFGAGAVLLDPETTDPFGRRPVRVSMGHVLQVPFARLDPWPASLDLVRDAGLAVVALTPDGDEALDDLPPRAAFLVGAEGPGLSEGALAAADRRVRIPMANDVDSVNVATALAIALHVHHAAHAAGTASDRGT
jgi:tRNA G18 (ribose-2'-O)-methylase SpoU